MSADDLHALLVFVVLGGGLAFVMLLVAVRRRHGLIAGATAVALVAALVAVAMSSGGAPRQVTPLLLLDGYSTYFASLFIGAALVVTLLSPRYLERQPDDPEEYYLLLLAATLGAVTLAAASHFASFLLGLEILSISLYVLVAYPRRGHPPLEAALKYLVLSGAASTTMLFGMALIYAGTGSLTFTALGVAGGDAYVLGGSAMLLAGAAFKLSLVPFHMWTPDVYQGAPAPVAGYLATVSKGAVMAVLLRLLLDSGALGAVPLLTVLSLLAVLSMLVGNLLALRQESIKRVLAYSAIAHFGYLVIPLVALGPARPELAAEAVLVYLGAYTVMTLGAFGAVTVLSETNGAEEADSLDAYSGLLWRHPGIAAVLTVTLLSLAGIPLTVGFIAKFYLFAAGVSAAAWTLLAALVVGSGIGLYYYLRIVFVMTRDADAAIGPPGAAAPAALSGRVTLGVLGVLLVVFGAYPAPFIDAVRQALQNWGG